MNTLLRWLADRLLPYASPKGERGRIIKVKPGNMYEIRMGQAFRELVKGPATIIVRTY